MHDLFAIPKFFVGIDRKWMYVVFFCTAVHI